MAEYELAAKFQYECMRNCADMLAYTPVVASGINALTIHYIQNKQKINSNELILMDAGAYYHGYNTDVTRTWSANGVYTDPQRELYELILKVQKKCIAVRKWCDTSYRVQKCVTS